MRFFSRQAGGRALLLAAVMVVITAGAAVGQVDITAKFKDPIFRDEVCKLIGKTGQCTILDSDVSGITMINVSSMNISDLSGIEYFTTLTLLSCVNPQGWVTPATNQLTTLDVSKNVALTSLNCGGNKLASLDVSKNIALTSLNCGGNKLASLDVSKNIALTSLVCDNNQLTTLDVSKNTALTSLDCGGNALTTLDVSKNIALWKLECYVNQLTKLDVSKNTALTRLACGNNQLTTLDVSKNTALTRLTCDDNQLTTLDVSKNAALDTLWCTSNQLTTLDVSKNTSLAMLMCHSNQLTTLDVSKNIALIGLNCGSNQLTALDVSKNTALTWLHCDNNKLTALDVLKNTALTSLSCDKNQLVALNVSGNAALTTLWCSSNQLTNIDVSTNTVLKGLYCSDNKLTNLDMSKNTALTWLSCGNNQLTMLNVSGATALTTLSCYDQIRSGYIFGGWYRDAAYTDKWNDDISMNLTLYAKWIPIFTVTFNANDGMVTTASGITQADSTLVSLPTPTRNCHIFNGWFTATTGGTAVTTSKKYSENTTIYAQWTLNTYTITWNADGGTPTPTQTSVNCGSSITVPSAMTKTGYTFDGWYTNYALTTAAAFPIADVTASKTFYAKWIINTYKVTWEVNGGTPVPTQTSVNHGNSITAPSVITKTGHIFGGWYTNSTFTEAATFPITNVTEPKTLYAKWIPIFTITFNAAGGAVTPASGATRADSTLASLPTPTKSDNAFNGWFTAETNGENVTEIRKYSANTIIYAQWTQSAYTLTLDPTGGSVTPTTVRIGESGRIVSLPNPTKAGNHFGGWFTATSGGERVTEGSVINKNDTLYARWVPIYTVTFNANGGTVLPETDTTGLGGNLASLPVPERDGYTFSGWFTAATGGTAVTASTVFSTNATIYAQWASKAYAITFGAGTNGAITATVDGNPIVTDALIPYGKDIVFTAIPADDYNVGSWMVNGRVVAEGTKVYTLVNFSAASVVTVTFNHVDAIASPNRVIPSARPDNEVTSISPPSQPITNFTVGPNPVGSLRATPVQFFHQGSRISSATLRIYDASGSVVCKVAIKDDATVNNSVKRVVGSWDLRDAKGRPVSDGAYLLRGVVKTSDGKRERVEVVVGVR